MRWIEGMMTKDDKPEFRIVFELVARCLRNRFKNPEDQRKSEIAYFTAMRGLPLAVVESAGEVFITQGSSDGWVPSSPEWIDVAEGLLVEQQIETVHQRKALPPSPEEMEADLVPVRAARDRFVAKCLAEGWEGIARVFKRLEIVHPSMDTRVLACEACSDTGMRMVTASEAGPCGCLETNPMIRARLLQAGRKGRVLRRKKRAADLNPRSAQALLN